MKFLFFLTVVVIAAILFFSFFGNLNQFFGNLNQPINPFGNGESSSSTPAIYNNQRPPSKNPSGATSSVPSGFKGPTGKPHIIGPPGPPPNY